MDSPHGPMTYGVVDSHMVGRQLGNDLYSAIISKSLDGVYNIRLYKECVDFVI